MAAGSSDWSEDPSVAPRSCAGQAPGLLPARMGSMTGNDAVPGWVLGDDEPADKTAILTEDRQRDAAEERRLASARAANADWGTAEPAS
jgi:hypothetical protein